MPDIQSNPRNVMELPQKELLIRSQQTPKAEPGAQDAPQKFSQWQNVDGMLDIIAQLESSNNPRAIGKQGERGLFQMMPSTAAQYGVSADALLDPVMERAVTKRYLTDLIQRYHGNIPKAIAAYNTGPGRVDKGEVPLSTHNYVNRFMNLFSPSEAGATEGAPPSSKAGKVGGVKPLDRYESFDELWRDWQHTGSYGRSTHTQRASQHDRLYQRWVMERANSPDPTAGVSGSPGDLDFTGRLHKEAVDYVTAQAGSVAGAATDFALPSTNIQAGIDLGLFMLGGPELKTIGKAAELLPEAAKPIGRFASRLGIPTLGGAIGGATEGKATQGAKQGLATGLSTEVGSHLFGLGKRGIQRLDVNRVGQWLSDMTGKETKNLPAIVRNFKGTEAISGAEAKVNQAAQAVDKVLKGQGGLGLGAGKKGAGAALNVAIPPDLAANPAFKRALGLPAGALPVTWDQAKNLLDEVESIGWDSRFRLARPKAAVAVRSAAFQMEKDIYSSLRKVDPKLAQRWLSARQEYRAARTFSNLFRTRGVLDGDKLNMSKLQELVTTGGPMGFKDDIAQSVGDKEAKQFEAMVHRGGEPGRTDVQGKNIVHHVGMHFGIMPRVWLQAPQAARHVGYIPYNLGRGRALLSAIYLGSSGLVSKITSMFDDSGVENESNANNAQP